MAEGEAVIRGMADAQKYGIVVPVSETAAPDFPALEALFRSLQGAPEDQERRMREARDKRAAIRAATPEETDIVAGIGRNMGWSPEYVRHLAQPYCDCFAGNDGWEHCVHATDLGLDR